MARITVVVFLLSSVFSIDAGMRHTAQVRNVTHLEKRFPMMEEEGEFPGCNQATYRTATLSDFVYVHNCFPVGWQEFLAEEKVRKEINLISYMIGQMVKPENNIFIEPEMHDMFKAFTVTRDQVKVVILGQDPTPQPNQATGMAFSLRPGVDPRSVPSVFNMLVELKSEGIAVDLSNGDLTPWQDQGVLLLNAALTVEQNGKPGYHRQLWKDFTKLLIQHISAKGPASAWILWGGEAQQFSHLIQRPTHYVKSGGHPSPQSAVRFFGGNYFRCANGFLNGIGRGGIAWQIPQPPLEHVIESIRAHAQC